MILSVVFIIFILNFLIVYKLDQIASLINIYDKPDNKLKKHKSDVPLLGGVIFLFNLLFFVLIYYFFFNDHFKIDLPHRHIFSILLLIISFFLIGLIDDKHKLKPENKLFTSIFFSLLALFLNDDLLILNISLTFLDNPIYLGNLAYFFSIFCIIILTNALNFYDGINGQSIFFFIFVFSYLLIKSPLYEFYFFVLVLLFFILCLNLLNKIFMGDSGMYLLGSILSLSLIYEYNTFYTFKFVDEIFLLLILPGYDLLRLSIIRFFRGKNLFYGDRNHIHHLLIDKFSLLKTNIILIFLSTLPIFLFSFLMVDFYIILSLFTITYILLILKLSKNDKKRNFRKAK